MKRCGSFSIKPKILVNQNSKTKPFILLNDVCYTSEQYSGLYIYNIWIHKGYNWNGANIPKFLWRIVGSQFNPEFLEASMVHDWLCENKYYIVEHGVKISSDIFREILLLNGVGEKKAWLMASFVRIYQYFQKGWNK